MVWAWIWKISPKNVISNFSIFFPSDQKKSLWVGSESTRVDCGLASYLLRVKSKLESGRVGSGPISMVKAQKARNFKEASKRWHLWLVVWGASIGGGMKDSLTKYKGNLYISPFLYLNQQKGQKRGSLMYQAGNLKVRGSNPGGSRQPFTAGWQKKKNIPSLKVCLRWLVLQRRTLKGFKI